jgi:hypothetical protein
MIEIQIEKAVAVNHGFNVPPDDLARVPEEQYTSPARPQGKFMGPGVSPMGELISGR